MRRIALAVAATAVAAALAGCSGSTMTQDEAEKQIASAIEKDNDVDVDRVSCPGDITAEVDESMTCDVTAEGETVKVKMTITSVEGGTARFDVEVVE